MLFGSLLLIFFFSFNFIKKTFFDAVRIEIANSKNFYHIEYINIHTNIDNTTAHFELILSIPTLITSFVNSYRTSVSTYNCVCLPRNTNYLFLYVEKHFILAKDELQNCLRADLTNSTEKTQLIEWLARKPL